MEGREGYSLTDLILGEMAVRLTDNDYVKDLVGRLRRLGYRVEDGLDWEKEVEEWDRNMVDYLGRRIEWGGYETWNIIREVAERWVDVDDDGWSL